VAEGAAVRGAVRPPPLLAFLRTRHQEVATLRLITWNLNARRRQIPAQVAALAARSLDLLALQEVTQGMLEPLRRELAAIGIGHAIDSFSVASAWEAKGPRRYGLMIAARFPMAASPTEVTVCWPERVLSAAVATPSGPLLLHTTHIPPGSSNGPTKIAMIEGVLDVIAATAPATQILCGDFNAPQLERADGRIVTWGGRVLKTGVVKLRRTRFRYPADRWDHAERGVMQGLQNSILIDAYRHLHGYGRQEFSWFLKRKELRIGRRFDHAFCSPDVKVLACEYLHHLREAGLSDHSPLELDFNI
jgi:exonuclease III